jgi:hypothetical protein
VTGDHQCHGDHRRDDLHHAGDHYRVWNDIHAASEVIGTMQAKCCRESYCRPAEPAIGRGSVCGLLFRHDLCPNSRRSYYAV